MSTLLHPTRWASAIRSFLCLITDKCSLTFFIIFWVCLNWQKCESHQYLWPRTDVYRCSMVIMFLGDNSLMFPCWRIMSLNIIWKLNDLFIWRLIQSMLKIPFHFGIVPKPFWEWWMHHRIQEVNGNSIKFLWLSI